MTRKLGVKTLPVRCEAGTQRPIPPTSFTLIPRAGHVKRIPRQTGESEHFNEDDARGMARFGPLQRGETQIASSRGKWSKSRLSKEPSAVRLSRSTCSSPAVGSPRMRAAVSWNFRVQKSERRVSNVSGPLQCSKYPQCSHNSQKTYATKSIKMSRFDKPTGRYGVPLVVL